MKNPRSLWLAMLAFLMASHLTFARGPELSRVTLHVGAPAHANLGDTIKGLARKVINGVKSLPSLLGAGLEEVINLGTTIKEIVQCFASGMGPLAQNLVSSHPVQSMQSYGRTVLDQVVTWIKAAPGDFVRELAATGKELLKSLRRMNPVGKGVSTSGLTKLAGDLLMNMYRLVRGQVDRQWALFFKRLPKVWPVTCLVMAKPMLDKVYKTITVSLLDSLAAFIKKLYDDEIASKLAGIIDRAMITVMGLVINKEALQDVLVDQMVETDAKLASLLKGETVEVKAPPAAQVAAALSSISITRPSFWIKFLKGQTIDRLMKWLSKKVKEKAKELLDKLDMKVAGIVLPIFDALAGEVAGLVAPLILQVVTAAGGTVGAIGSIVTAAVKQVIMVFLTQLYSQILWPYIVDKPANVLLDIVIDKIGKNVVQFGLNAVTNMAGGSADAIASVIMDRVARLIPLSSGTLNKVLQSISNLFDMAGGVTRLRAHVNNLQGLISDIAQTKGKVCGMTIPAVARPQMNTSEMQSTLLNLVLDKIIGSAQTGETVSTGGGSQPSSPSPTSPQPVGPAPDLGPPKFCLKTHRGLVVTVLADARIVVKVSRCQIWEELTLVKPGGGAVQSGDKVYLRTHHNKFLSAHPNGDLTAATPHMQDWEAFEVHKAGGGPVRAGDKVGFKGAHGQWIVDGKQGMRANGPARSLWEEFELVPVR